jgi:hypothetical protein
MEYDAIAKALERLGELGQAEEERLREELIATRVALEVKLRMAEQQPQLYRFEMSAAAISRFIRGRIAAGRSSSEAQQDYLSLPLHRPGTDPRRGNR